MKKFLIKHVGNMGDLVFFIPPILSVLKQKYPDCHITFITPWGFKDKHGRWGKRNQDGFCVSLIMTNPHIDQLIHWHDTKLDLSARTCCEDGRCFPTWNRQYFNQQKNSGSYTNTYELDFGIGHEDNPLKKIYRHLGLPQADFTNYKIYLTPQDEYIASNVMASAPHPRIILLEGLEGATTRGWDPGKIDDLSSQIKKIYRVAPIWFGGKYTPEYKGRPLTLRENMATLTFADAAIGVMSGPLHFAAAVGAPTLTLFCDQALHRSAPAFFLNKYIADKQRRHRTLLGPSSLPYTILKSPNPPPELTSAEVNRQHYKNWTRPGKQSTKSGLAAITVSEIMTVLQDILPPG
ncbi:MAG: glycosyltransferase family 9 protein [bacterium]|nr:glycosyltransferase family 9 protein [bacterium]MDZ4342242.1 glycosyltransferase family 9 protein [Candidatus Binatia bacterium]